MRFFQVQIDCYAFEWELFFFFLGVAGAICLAPFSRTSPSDFFPQWLILSPFASAASYRWETANCSLCKVRRVFVIQLEVLRIWMWGETAALWGPYLHTVWRWAQLCLSEFSTGPLWAKSKPCSYTWCEMEHWVTFRLSVVLVWYYSFQLDLSTSVVWTLLARYCADIAFGQNFSELSTSEAMEGLVLPKRWEDAQVLPTPKQRETLRSWSLSSEGQQSCEGSEAQD